MGGPKGGMLPFAIFRVPLFLLRGEKTQATSSVDMGHISGPTSHVSIANLVRSLRAMTMQIWDCECEPFGPIFAFFAISGQVGNTISPWGMGPSRKQSVILVAYDQGSKALGFRICISGLAGVMQPMVRATLPNFDFLAVFCPVA